MKRKLTKIEEETQLPFESITTVEQCIEAFEFIAKELQGIEEDFEEGFDLISFSGILREAINLTDYNKVSEKIKEKLQKINRVTS